MSDLTMTAGGAEDHCNHQGRRSDGGDDSSSVASSTASQRRPCQSKSALQPVSTTCGRRHRPPATNADVQRLHGREAVVDKPASMSLLKPRTISMYSVNPDCPACHDGSSQRQHTASRDNAVI